MTVDARDRPVVIWSAPDASGVGQVYVARFEGGAWVRLGADDGGVSETPGESEWPRVLGTPDGALHATWEEALTSGEVEIYYRVLEAP